MTARTETDFRTDVGEWLNRESGNPESHETETLTGTPANQVFQFPDVIFGDFVKAAEIEHIADALIHEHRERFAYLSDA